MKETIGIAALLGTATGIRSTSGFAILASGREVPEDSPLHTDALRRSVQAAFVGEAVADKTGVVPARTELVPWVGRAVMGGAAAALAASWLDAPRVSAALVGALTAVGAAWGATLLRSVADERGVPDFLPAIAEDLCVAGLGVAAERLVTAGLSSRWDLL